MTAALEMGEWSAARPGRTLPPRKKRYPFYRRLGGPQGRSGRAENLVPTGIQPRTIQPIVSCYTDWATGPTIIIIVIIKYNKQTNKHTLSITQAALFHTRMKNIYYCQDIKKKILQMTRNIKRILKSSKFKNKIDWKYMSFVITYFMIGIRK